MNRFLLVIALITCKDLYEYIIVSDVPLDFNVKDGLEKTVEISEKKIPNESKSDKSSASNSKGSGGSDGSDDKKPSPPSKRRSPSPRRSNVLDSSNNSAWSRMFNVFVPGSSTNRAFNEVSYETDSFWYGDD